MGEFGEMDNYRWGDINMSGGHYFIIINIMITICQVWSLFYNNQYHDINMSGGHDYVIISDIFFKYHDINMSGGHNFVI